MSRFLRWLMVGVVLAVLSGCGGGGSSDSNMPIVDDSVKINLNTENLNLSSLSELTLASSNAEVSADGVATLSLEKEDKDVVGLLDEGGVPILIGRKFEGDESVDVSLESSAYTMVLMHPQFLAGESKNPKELYNRIVQNSRFSQLKDEIKNAIVDKNPCPIDPICNYKAFNIAKKIVSEIKIDDLY